MEIISDELEREIKSLFNGVNNRYEGISWNEYNFILDETGDHLHFGGDFVKSRIVTQNNILYLVCLSRINYNHPSGSDKRGRIAGSPATFTDLFLEAKKYKQFKDILKQICYPENLTESYLKLGPINELEVVVNNIFNIAIIKLHYGGIIKGTIQSVNSVKPVCLRVRVPRQHDHSRRIKVELAAEEMVVEYYEKNGYNTKPVQRENRGWDFEFTKKDEILYVEVKGRSSDDISAELTPNEYTNMLKHRDKYRICIVTEALTERNLYEFFWKNNAWKTENGETLNISERKGAVISVL